MKTRIAIYGGTILLPEVEEFVRYLTEHLLAIPEVVILSGGFLRDTGHSNRMSVDNCVLQAVKSRLTPAELDERFETWLPSPALDRPTVQRFREGSIRELHGTSQARRFKLVQETDGLITISGKEHTRSLLELALALEKPALPIPFTGGNSLTIWKRNRIDILKSLRISSEAAAQFDLQPCSRAQREKLASIAVDNLYCAAQRRCLVLMPFGGSHDVFYTKHLRFAILRSNFVPHRIDQDDYAGDIPTLFHQAIDRCSAAVVDLTGINSNVLYELGHLHARKMAPLLLLRSPASGRTKATLPFYLLQEKVFMAADSERGRQLMGSHVERYLLSTLRRAASQPHAMSDA